MQKEFPCVTRYFVTLAHQPQFKAVVGDMALATEEQKYVRASQSLRLMDCFGFRQKTSFLSSFLRRSLLPSQRGHRQRS